MKMRPIWTGHLKISLVQMPVRVYTALNAAQTIQFNQLHRDCHQRVRQKLCCPVHGEITREEIVKGYEFEKDKYVVVPESDLEKIRLETTQTIEIVQFIRQKELDPVHLETPYYVGPDGQLAVEGYCVLQQALQRSGLLGIGRVVLAGREKLVALKTAGKGLIFSTLRPSAELRSPESVFDDLVKPKLDPEQVQLAQKLIEQKTGSLDDRPFVDRYQAALLELVQAKVKGGQPVLLASNPAHNVVGLMDALRQSLAVGTQTKESKSQSSQAKIAA